MWCFSDQPKKKKCKTSYVGLPPSINTMIGVQGKHRSQWWLEVQLWTNTQTQSSGGGSYNHKQKKHKYDTDIKNTFMAAVVCLFLVLHSQQLVANVRQQTQEEKKMHTNLSYVPPLPLPHPKMPCDETMVTFSSGPSSRAHTANSPKHSGKQNTMVTGDVSCILWRCCSGSLEGWCVKLDNS